MKHALFRLKGWLLPEPPKSRAVSGSARAQLNRIESQQQADSRKLDRISWHLTKAILHLPTSGLTASSPLATFPGSTAMSAATPTAATAPATASPAPPPPLLRHGKKYAPKVAAWLAEQALKYLWPLLLSSAVGAWAAVRKWGEQIATWLTSLWTLLAG